MRLIIKSNVYKVLVRLFDDCCLYHDFHVFPFIADSMRYNANGHASAMRGQNLQLVTEEGEPGFGFIHKTYLSVGKRANYNVYRL